tara:strand:- start:67028 stop:67420 length:393 start_codon:yes stop_codon:yes gene_type:complete
MAWKKQKKHYGLYENYSVINKFLKEEKVDYDTLNNIGDISLEDLIAIKLELSTRILGGKFYGMPLWHSIKAIASEAVLKTAVSICRSKNESAKFLGIEYTDFRRLIKKYNVESFFEDERNGGETVSTENE